MENTKNLGEFEKMDYMFYLEQINNKYKITIPDLEELEIYGDSIDDVLNKYKDEKNKWLQNEMESKGKIPDSNNDIFHSGTFILRLPKELQKGLTINAKKRGMSFNQYCIYLLKK